MIFEPSDFMAGLRKGMHFTCDFQAEDGEAIRRLFEPDREQVTFTLPNRDHWCFDAEIQEIPHPDGFSWDIKVENIGPITITKGPLWYRVRWYLWCWVRKWARKLFEVLGEND